MAESKVYRKKSNTASRVAAELRRAIRRGDLLPGEHVRQEQWAARMGVSSGPTREALKMLVSEQLLSYQAHHGYFVTRISSQEMTQIYQLRRLLENETIRSMRWPTAGEIKELRGMMDHTLELIGQSDVSGALEASREVLFKVFDLSPLDIVVRETKRYYDMTMIYQMVLLGTVDNPHSNRLSTYYDRMIEFLEANDRDGLLALNNEERARIPRDFFTY